MLDFFSHTIVISSNLDLSIAIINIQIVNNCANLALVNFSNTRNPRNLMRVKVAHIFVINLQAMKILLENNLYLNWS